MNKDELMRVEQLKHEERLLANCVNYLWEVWNIGDCDIEKSFKNLGFTDEDLKYWELNEDNLEESE